MSRTYATHLRLANTDSTVCGREVRNDLVDLVAAVTEDYHTANCSDCRHWYNALGVAVLLNCHEIAQTINLRG